MMRLLALVLCACFVSCSAAAQEPSEAPATNAVIFDVAWKHARDHFFDPDMQGVDWDEARERHRPRAEAAETQKELSDAINALLAELNTSHTAHFTPDDVAYYHLLDVFKQSAARTTYDGIEAWVREHEDGLLIYGLWPGGNAAAAGLLVGDVITEIDGNPPTPVASFRGRAGDRVTLSVRRQSDADPIAVDLLVKRIRPAEAMLRAMKRSVQVIEHEGLRIGYIQVLSYAGTQYQDLLLKEIFDGRLKDADALLIDLRDGWGGAMPQYLDPFLKGPVMSVEDRDGSVHVYPHRWNKPVGLLINEGSRSGKEVLAYGFREYNLGPVIGEKTAGAVVAGTLHNLPDGSIMYLGVADVHVDGERLEGAGVEPTVHIPFDPLYAQGKDPQLEAGLEKLAELVHERK